jgi:hypothetical protein
MTENKGAAFLAQVRGEAARAQANSGGAVERWFEIAGLVLRFRFYGTALMPYLVPAISHRETAPRTTAPDATLHCWDCASLGLEIPRAPVPISAFTPRGEVRGLNDAHLHTAFDAIGRLLSVFDVEAREAFWCVGDARQIPRFDRAEPIRALLSWIMREHGRQLMHAAAVGYPDGGVLLVGRSGAGKSNTAVGTLTSDLSFVSDDFCVVSADGPPMAWSLYCTAKTVESDWQRHPFLATLDPDLDHVRGDKVIYFLDATMPQKLIAGFPLKAILRLRRGGDSCSFRPAPPNRAVAEAAPDTACILPDAGPEVLRAIGRLARQLPCYDLFLGPDPGRIPESISGLLAELRAERLQPA